MMIPACALPLGADCPALAPSATTTNATRVASVPTCQLIRLRIMYSPFFLAAFAGRTDRSPKITTPPLSKSRDALVRRVWAGGDSRKHHDPEPT